MTKYYKVLPVDEGPSTEPTADRKVLNAIQNEYWIEILSLRRGITTGDNIIDSDATMEIADITCITTVCPIVKQLV